MAKLTDQEWAALGDKNPKLDKVDNELFLLLLDQGMSPEEVRSDEVRIAYSRWLKERKNSE